MLEQTERISFRMSSVLSKVEPEPDLHTGSDQKVPAPAPQHCLPVPIKGFLLELLHHAPDTDFSGYPADRITRKYKNSVPDTRRISGVAGYQISGYFVANYRYF